MVQTFRSKFNLVPGRFSLALDVGRSQGNVPWSWVAVNLIKAVCHIVFPQIRGHTLVSIHPLGCPSGSPLWHSRDSSIIKNILILPAQKVG